MSRPDYASTKRPTPLPLNRTVVAVAGLAVVLSFPLALVFPTVASASSVTAVMSPGPYLANHPMTISVPANSLFTPGVAVNIMECADPGGLSSALPINDMSCDGNTIQGNTIFVGTKGQFAESGFQLYRLPSKVLGEPSDTLPKCDPTHACVLFIGQQQNNFSKPHIFSAPFYVDGPLIAQSGGSGLPTIPIVIVVVLLIISAAAVMARKNKKATVDA